MPDVVTRQEVHEPNQSKVKGQKWKDSSGAERRYSCVSVCSVFLFPRLDPLLVFEGLTVFCLWGTKNTGYACAQSCYGLVKRPHGRLSNRC